MTEYTDLLQQYSIRLKHNHLKGRALLRVDINVPVRNGKIVSKNLRFNVVAKCIEAYCENGLIPIILSHQGRVRGDDYLESMEQHARVLGSLLKDVHLIYSNSLTEETTKDCIKKLGKGEALLLKNTRAQEDEERKFKSLEEGRNCGLVKFFVPLADCYINDAPATMHRSDTSLTAFTHSIPSYLGLQMEEELKVLSEIDEQIRSGRRVAIIFGGKKWEKFDYVYRVAANENVNVLCGGVPGQSICYLKNRSKFNNENEEFILRSGSLDTAADLIKNFEQRIVYPIDFVLDSSENVGVEDLKEEKGLIMDIGENTLGRFFDAIENAEVIVYAGPVGRYEKGYKNTIRLVTRFMGLKTSNFTLGGNSVDSMDEIGLDHAYEFLGGKRITSGGSGLAFLAGEKLPALEAFRSVSNR